MKLNQHKIFLIFLYFNVINTLNIIIPKYGYEEFEIKPGITKFIYNYFAPYSNDKNLSFISFKFSEKNIFLEEEINSENEINECPKDLWLTFSLNYLFCLNVSSTTFLIINNNSFPVQMNFIDNSKEINIDLERFINLNFNTNFFTFQPTPLIFNINAIKKTSTLSLKKNFESKLFKNNNNLYYCINDEKECEFKEFNYFTFEKEKKYAFKLNYNYIKNQEEALYYFNQIELDEETFKEIEFGITNFEINENTKVKYFIVGTGINGIWGFYYLIKYDNAKYSFITKAQKENILEELNQDKFSFFSMSTETIVWSGDKPLDYMIIKIEYYSKSYIGSISLLNTVWEMEDTGAYYIIKDNSHALLKKSRLLFIFSPFYIMSSRKNLALLDSSFKYEGFTNILYLEDEKYFSNFYIYVNSTKYTMVIYQNQYLDIKSFAKFLDASI